MPKTPIVLALTPGDPEGIGPEIAWKAIQGGTFQKKGISLLCVGAKAPFEKLKAPIVEFHEVDRSGPLSPLSSQRKPFIWLLPAPDAAPKGRFLPGYQAGWSIEKATRLVLEKKLAALVTGPISKDRLQKGGYEFPGHTEFLAALCKQNEVTMMLANDHLRVSLVTTHIGIKDVPAHLNRSSLRRCILQTVKSLKEGWGISFPKIGVAALNPHAGENGRFGREEIEILQPEIESLARENGNSFRLSGPHPADTLFALNALARRKDRYDAVICLYHDQGLIPVKLLDFYHTVNVTLGLPMIRTSVDHGVGFDIAGQDLANPSSLCAAIELAARLANP